MSHNSRQPLLYPARQRIGIWQRGWPRGNLNAGELNHQRLSCFPFCIARSANLGRKQCAFGLQNVAVPPRGIAQGHAPGHCFLLTNKQLFLRLHLVSHDETAQPSGPDFQQSPCHLVLGIFKAHIGHPTGAAADVPIYTRLVWQANSTAELDFPFVVATRFVGHVATL